MLTEEEIKVLKSMSLYWDEVFGREDKSPLAHEVYQVVSVIGPLKLLKIIQKEINNDNRPNSTE